MQFDLKQFLRTGRVPYTAALECDLSGWDWPGYEPVGPITGEFSAALDENAARMLAEYLPRADEVYQSVANRLRA